MLKSTIYYLPLILIPFIQSCGSDAHAESPCPSSINEISIKLIDSLTDENIYTAEVIVSGEVYDQYSNQMVSQEFVIPYNEQHEGYYLDTLENDIEIDKENLIVYSLVDSHHYNVFKPNTFEIGCTSFEKSILLCPQGTACR